MQVLREIEAVLKKSPPFKFGPRTIDLDLLLYGDSIIPSKKEWMRNYKLPATSYKLMVPHPRMHERRFVLEPLCELIDPRALHPTRKKPWNVLLESTNDQECVRAQETR